MLGIACRGGDSILVRTLQPFLEILDCQIAGSSSAQEIDNEADLSSEISRHESGIW